MRAEANLEKREPLRIAMLSYHTCPLATLGGKDTGGMNVYVRDLARQLGRIGVHVDVYTRSQDEHVPHVLHDLGFGNRVVHIPAGPERPMPKEELAAFLPDFVREIRKFTAEKELTYDLIHSHYWLSGLAARYLKPIWEAPIIHMFHTLGLMKQRVARGDESDGDFRIQGEQEVLRIADRIVAATPAELAQLQWLYRADIDRVRIIPPGVDLSHFYPIPNDEAKAYVGMAPEDTMLLFVGRIEPLKGIDTLLRALALMREDGALARHRICLAIIGGDPEVSEATITDEMSRLKALCQDYGLGRLVTFLGRQSQDNLPYYYSAAAVTVVPSHYESFGMVALESMACGTPVVASQVGGLAFLVQHGVTGFHVPDGDPEALADCLMRLVADPSLRRELGARGADYARGYSWEIIADRIVELYYEVWHAGASLAEPSDKNLLESH